MTVVALELNQSDIENLAWPDLPTELRVKKALKAALKRGITPSAQTVEEDVLTTVKMALSGNDEVQLRQIVFDGAVDATLSDKAAGIVRGYARAQHARQVPESGASWIDKPRDEQQMMCGLMANSASRGGILFMEAWTGTGKGRALAAHAAHLVSKGLSERVVVAAPTIAVLGQLVMEYQALKPRRPRFASMIGMNEFVSEMALRQVLDSPESEELPNVEAARAWLSQASRSRWGDLEKPWLCASLEEAAPGFPLAEVRLNPHLRALTSSDEDGGVRAYERCEKDASDFRVVFCTHAKLAFDVVQRLYLTRNDGLDEREARAINDSIERWHADIEKRATCDVTAQLPKYDTLLIDEAHLLEGSFDRATSDQLSLFSMKLLIEKHGPPGLKAVMERVFKTLTDIGQRENAIVVGPGYRADAASEQASECLLSLVRSMKRNRKSIKNKAAQSVVQEFIRKMYWVERKQDDRRRFATQISFSPSRRYPLVERSRRSVNQELTFLWKSVNSAVLTSATLYLPSAGGPLMKDTRQELRVPQERAEAMTPIEPPWATAPVTVHLPPASVDETRRDALFVPPKADASKEEWATYYDALAAYIAKTLEQRRSGGTLILMTSYEGVGALYERLRAAAIGDRCIRSERHESFEQRKREYLKAVESSVAPVWLTTGRAWTGLDLRSGNCAAEDHGIDYLIIPRLPVMMNVSNIYRQYLLSDDEPGRFGQRDVWHCGRYLRQGLGRVVRQSGVPEKEIFVLDGRLCGSVRSRLTRLRAIFENYKKQRTIQ